MEVSVDELGPLAYVIERAHWNSEVVQFVSRCLVSGGRVVHEGRQPGVDKLVKRDLRSRAVRDGGLHHLVAWPRYPEPLGVFGHGIDVDASPAPVIKGLRDRQLHWIAGTHVHVPGFGYVPKGSPENNIL